MAGWPWPLDAVQSWFESLWQGILVGVNAAVSWVTEHVFDPLVSWFQGVWSWFYYAAREGFDLTEEILSGVGEPWKSLARFFLMPFAFAYTFLKPLINAVYTGLRPIVDAIRAGMDKVGQTVYAALPQPLKDFISWLGELGKALWTGLNNFVRDPVGTLKAGWDAISTTVSTGLSSLWTNITGFLGTLWNNIQGGINLIGQGISAVGQAVGNAVNTIGDWVSGVLKGIVDAMGMAFKGFVDYLWGALSAAGQAIVSFVSESVLPPLMGALNWIRDAIYNLLRAFWDSVMSIFGGHSPITPEEAYGLTVPMLLVGAGAGFGVSVMGAVGSMKALGTGIEARAISDFLKDAFALGDIASNVIMPIFRAAYVTGVTYYWNSVFTPMIPGSGDLVRMVVREAFDPKMVISAPAEFVSAMAYQGFSKVWCDRYWTAHFEPIALRQAYENLWRGYWTKEQFMFALHIADVHPMWREDIFKVAFTAPSTRELGYGFDVGEYSVEDITMYRRWEGLSEEDAKKAARSMVAYRTEAEREALRREALADFEAWLDDEPQLRANLKAIGGRDEIINLWVERAKFRRERDFILDMVKVSVDLHYKGHINDQGLDQDLIELGITPEGRQKIITEAKERRLKAVVAEKIAKKKVMPEARVRQARDLGLISDPEYVRRLLDHDWTEEDARLDLAIELTPKPVTVEEVERRRKTVTSKRARAVRRYETSLARIQDQIDLTAAQLDDTRVTMKESLDIIDAQLAIVEEDLAVAPPEKVPALEGRRTVLVQRRELQVTRWETRIRELTEQHKNLLETRDLVTRQRDEELAEYDAELKLLEVAG